MKSVRSHLWAVVVAGGSGARFGRRKQFDRLHDRSVLAWSCLAMARYCQGVVVVVPSDSVETVDKLLAADGEWPEIERRVVAGGDSRSASVRAGLDALGGDAGFVLVHDGARPLVSRTVVEAVIQALERGASAAVPAVAVTDTLRRVGGGAVDRSQFVAVQTPQGFALSDLRAAHASATDATDDATLMDHQGAAVVHTTGSATNIKITVPTDLAVATALLADPEVAGALAALPPQ